MVPFRVCDGLFGGHVVDRPQRALVLFDRAFGVAAGNAGHTHVEDFDNALLIDQQVGRFDVAMDHVSAVGVCQTLGRLADVVDRLCNLQGAVGFDSPLQVLPLDVLHHYVVTVSLFVDVVGVNDIGVVQSGDCPGLGEEPLDGRGGPAEIS